MNVLLTCAGRRNYLIGYFRDALRGRGMVLAADSSPTAPALGEADRAFIVPCVDEPHYFETLLDICQTHHAKLLISLNDLELPLLSRQRERFAKVGTVAVVSSPEVVDTCFDKWESLRFLGRHGIDAPKTYCSIEGTIAAVHRGELAFPLVVKPRWGTASIGIEYPEDEEELILAYRLVSNRLNRTILAQVSADVEQCVIVQEKLSGDEYGLDVVNDLAGNHAATFAKHKLSMRAGETDRAVTVNDQTLRDIGEHLARSLGHVGNLDCDVFVCGERVCVLEMNPRFGGGYPFSHVAGANVPAALVAWAEGKESDQAWLHVRPGIQSSKCDRLVLGKEWEVWT